MSSVAEQEYSIKPCATDGTTETLTIDSHNIIG